MLLGMAIERGMPVVGFCRGHQMINRYFGGKIANIPKVRNPRGQPPICGNLWGLQENFISGGKIGDFQ